MKFKQTATVINAHGVHALRVRIARGLWSRFRGLMLTSPLHTEPTPQALFIPRCPSVHGFFMRYALDVVYLAADAEKNLATPAVQHYCVTHMAHLKPWRMSMGKKRVLHTAQGQLVQRSAHALELPAGSIERMGLQLGDTVEVHT